MSDPDPTDDTPTERKRYASERILTHISRRRQDDGAIRRTILAQQGIELHPHDKGEDASPGVTITGDEMEFGAAMAKRLRGGHRWTPADVLAVAAALGYGKRRTEG